MEGRDIGSVVFPDADAKILLQAHLTERLRRRERERGDPAAEAVSRRDDLDSRLNPFVPADGAVVIDTTGKTMDEVVDEAMAIVRARIAESRP
jgi:cytidylate kinase